MPYSINLIKFKVCDSLYFQLYLQGLAVFDFFANTLRNIYTHRVKLLHTRGSTGV